MLKLNDPIWSTLRTRSADGTSLIPTISALPCTDARYYELLCELCDLDTNNVFSAAYAVLPHFAAFIERCESPIDRKWPLFVSAAVASTYKCNAANIVPPQLEADFTAATQNLQHLSIEFLRNYPDGDPDFMLAVGLPPVLDTSARPAFGDAVAGSFYLAEWFNSRKPFSAATQQAIAPDHGGVDSV